MKEKIVKYKARMVSAVLIAAALTGAYCLGGGNAQSAPPGAAAAAPGTETPASAAAEPVYLPGAAETPEANPKAQPSAEPTGRDLPPCSSPAPQQEAGPQSAAIGGAADGERQSTGSAPEGTPVQAGPDDGDAGMELTCTLSVNCGALVDHLDMLEEEKRELVPGDGIIFAARAVSFREGESVFDVLEREMKEAGIQMEFMKAPVYGSSYVEGIGNLYEFDAGGMSGWMYSVNGRFPNCGYSQYELQDGDVVEWVYTCDLGGDAGNSYAAGT